MTLFELTDSQLERIAKGVEQLMAEPGFVVQDARILKQAEAAGAQVDHDEMRIRIDPALLWELAAKAPGTFTLNGITGESFTLGNGNQYAAGIVTDPFIADYPSGRPRKPALADVIRNTKIIQNDPRMAMVSRMDYPVTDIEGPASTHRALEAHLLHHVKPYSVYVTSHESFMDWLALGDILNSGRPLSNSGLFVVAVAVLSPLVLTKVNCDILWDCVQYGFPVIPTVCPMAGSTSPYTLEGTLVQGIAENLMVLCLAQMLRPGHPFLYSFGPSVTEMANGYDLYYTMDKVLWKLAAMQFGKKRLKVPCAAEMGGALGCRYDMQSGAEGMVMVLSALMSGADLLAGMGSCLNANGLSSEFIVIHNAYLQAAGHLQKGLDLGELDESIEAIRSQGPGGNFLMDDLTLEHLRDHAFFQHPLFDTSAEQATTDTPGMLQRAHAEVERIEAEYRCPVPEQVAENIKKYFHDYCAKL